ncbi:MAG: spore maturation protein [Firmicutes bacterium]|nr:spore maturation protein [Bacillota bacterium]
MKYIMPALICAVLLLALSRKKPAYELFIEGAADGLKMLKSVLPPMIAIMSSVYMARASGAFDLLVGFVSRFTDKIGMSGELIPLALIRPLSGSGSMGIFTDILNRCGADSAVGKAASVMYGSTETTFYCLCVYFSRTRVKNTLKAVPYAVFGDIVSVVCAVLITSLF